MNLRDTENLTVPEAVQVFGIGRTKLYELISTGRIEAFKLGRRTLIRASSVRNFVSELPSLPLKPGGAARAASASAVKEQDQ